MTYRTSYRKVVGGAAVLACLALPLATVSADSPMLGSLAKGAWEMRVRTNGQETARICVRDGREFIQIKHRQPGCSQFVVSDAPHELIVQYTCRGNGYGRTAIRREADRLIQIDSQGIVDGAPFAFKAEARHTGAGC